MRTSLRRYDCVLVLLLLVCLVLPIEGMAAADVPAATPAGTTRTYNIAAEEIEWTYIPDGKDMMMTHAFDSYARAPNVVAIAFLDRTWLQGDYSNWCGFPYSALAGFRWTMSGLAFPDFRSNFLVTVIPF